MRTSLRRKSKPGRQVSRVETQLAPVKGWIANENIIEMSPEDAYQLDNWFPDVDSIRLRPGFAIHNFLSGSNSIDTLMVYQSGTQTNIFAAAGASIFDVTAISIPVPPAPSSTLVAGGGFGAYGELGYGEG